MTATAAKSGHHAIEDRQIVRLAETFRLLADATRLRIVVYVLAAGEGGVCVNEICRHIGTSQPGISHHLAMMRLAGLLETRRAGKQVFYAIRPEGFREITGFLAAV